MNRKNKRLPGSPIPEGTRCLRILLQSAVTWMAVSCSLEVNPMLDYWGLRGFTAVYWNLTESFESYSFARFMLLPGIFLLYTFISRAWERDGEYTLPAGAPGTGRRLGPSVRLPAAFFAGMMILGWSFSHDIPLSLSLTFADGQLLKSALVFGGYYLLYRYLIQYVYLKYAVGFRRPSFFRAKKPKILLWYEKHLLRAPFRTAALTLLILYLPLMIVSYPGMIVADTVGQTLRGYPLLAEPTILPEAAKAGKPLAHLNNHHPVAHTLLIHYCLSLADRVLHSWNAGFYLYSVLQELAFICVVAFLLREYIRKRGVSVFYAVGVLAYLFASPFIHNFVIQNTKDVFYSLFLLMTVYYWHELLKEGGRRNLLLLLLFATGSVLFRNEGQYVLMLAAAGTICLNRESRKRFAVVLLYLAVFSAGYFHLLFPALGIAPGSRREMLSVPFQQTARYLVKYGDEVTEEERQAIDAVLDYDRVAGSYNPVSSDPVKDLYREETATPAALVRYLINWARMGLKHPKTYLAAFMRNNYEYFYPDHGILTVEEYRRSGFLFGWLTELAEPMGIAPAQPAFLAPLRNLADDTLAWITGFSPLTFFMITSLYPTFAILLLCCAIRKRDRTLVSVSLIPLLTLMACLAGPYNGSHSRYLLPLALAWPFFDPIIRPRRESLPANA